jgi:hypothetical protein
VSLFLLTTFHALSCLLELSESGSFLDPKEPSPFQV